VILKQIIRFFFLKKYICLRSKPDNEVWLLSFLQRMELGHLVIKGDLLDCKINCRILGAIVLKLESRHNRTQNFQAAV
jgi:hypothetical protein